MNGYEMKINHSMSLFTRAIDSGSYDWKKLDPKSDECKKLITQYWKWEVSSQSWSTCSCSPHGCLMGFLDAPLANSGVAYCLVTLRLMPVKWLQASEDLTKFRKSLEFLTL